MSKKSTFTYVSVFSITAFFISTTEGTATESSPILQSSLLASKKNIDDSTMQKSSSTHGDNSLSTSNDNSEFYFESDIESDAIDSNDTYQISLNSSSTSSNLSNGEKVSYLSTGRAKFYIGAGFGAGEIESGNDDLLTSYLLEPLASLATDTKVRSGGFSWKVFTGILTNINKYVDMGAEVGFTNYPDTKVTNNLLPSVLSVINPSSPISVNGSFTFKGYGIDLLYNTTFRLGENFYFGLKPGFQFAYQKSKLFADVKLDDFNLNLNSSYYKYKFLPQVMLNLGYEFNNRKLGAWDLREVPFYVDMYYQHVFGSSDSPINKRVSSRDAVGGSLGVRF